MQKTRLVENGEIIGHVEELLFWDPDNFVARELHKHITQWAEIAKLAPSSHQEEVLSWIGNKVSIFPYFKHFRERSRGNITIPIGHPTNCLKIMYPVNSLESLSGRHF